MFKSAPILTLIVLCALLLLVGCGTYKAGHTTVEVIDGCYVKIEGLTVAKNGPDRSDWSFGDDCTVTIDGKQIKGKKIPVNQ